MKSGVSTAPGTTPEAETEAYVNRCQGGKSGLIPQAVQGALGITKWGLVA